MNFKIKNYFQLSYFVNNSIKLLLFFTYSLGYSQTTSIDQLRKYPEKTVLVAAHRGDWKSFPENSLPAIESCIKNGIDIVEVDVQMTKDKKFILMHDPSINRTTNGKGLVKNLTLDNLKRYRLKDPDGKYGNEKIPTLEEALLLAKGRVILNLDKSSRYFDELLLIIDSLDVRQIVILKGSVKDTTFTRRIIENPDGPLFMPILTYKPLATLESIFKNSKAEVMELILANDTSYLSTRKGIELFKENKCKIWYNALTKNISSGYDEKKDALKTWDYFVSSNAYIIQTDYPFQLMQHLINIGVHPKPSGWQNVDLSDLPKITELDSAQIKKGTNASERNMGKRKKDEKYYFIKSDDTLSKIASKNKTTVTSICYLNKDLSPTTILSIGRQIRIK